MTRVNSAQYSIYLREHQNSVNAKKPKQDFIPLVKKEEEPTKILTLVDFLKLQNEQFKKWADECIESIYPNSIKQIKYNIHKAMTSLKRYHTENDLQYWGEIVSENHKKSNLPPELLIALISRETGFRKHIGGSSGNGPMQITSITAQDMFSNSNGGRLALYEKLDKAMMDEILYKEDEEGNLVPRFRNYKELHAACAKDDDLGVKVGIMCFKMKYVHAVCDEIGCSFTDAIKGLLNGMIQFTPEENKEIITKTLINYNSVFTKEYATAVMDSISSISGKDSLDLILLK